MIEVSILLFFLFSLWVFGRSLIIVCLVDGCDWLAMPIGLCLVALLGNVLYFMLGFTAQSIQLLFLCALLPCLFIIFRQGVCRSEWCRLAAVLGIFLLLALPAWIGGEQYYVFRGNHWDNFNYIDQALTIWDNPYPIYQHALANNFFAKDVLVHGLTFMNARPVVGLVFATLLPNGLGNIHLLAFLYVTALWALVFPAACFAWRRVIEAYELSTSNLLLLVGPPFAYVVGFWGQYIFDTNAWSQIASMPLLLAFVFGYIRLLQKLADPLAYEGKPIMSEYVMTGLLGAGAFLFYPENTLIQAAFLLVATILWYAVIRKIPRFTTVVSLAVFSIAVLLISSIPYWNGTVGFVIGQIKFGMGHGPNWWDFFDRYWFGLHSNALFSQIASAVVSDSNWRECFSNYWHGVHVPLVVGSISTFANLILASVGMFFVTPDYSMQFWLRNGWIGITVVLAALIVYTLSVSLFVRFRENQTSVFLKAFFLSGVLFLLYLLQKHALWSFGKGLSYLSPYLFLVLCLGLIETSRKTKITSLWSSIFGDILIRWVVIIFLISQIVFGMIRLYSARDPNGIGYDNATYPSIQDPKMKIAYSWNMNPQVYKHCKGVSLLANKDIDPFYMAYVKQKLVYLKVPYFSLLPITASAGASEAGFQQSIVTDCDAVLIKQSDKWILVKR